MMRHESREAQPFRGAKKEHTSSRASDRVMRRRRKVMEFMSMRRGVKESVETMRSQRHGSRSGHRRWSVATSIAKSSFWVLKSSTTSFALENDPVFENNSQPNGGSCYTERLCLHSVGGVSALGRTDMSSDPGTWAVSHSPRESLSIRPWRPKLLAQSRCKGLCRLQAGVVDQLESKIERKTVRNSTG